MTDNPAPPTKSQIHIPQPTPEQLKEQIRRLEEIVSRLNHLINPSTCDDMRTIGGETQVSGKKAESLIQQTLSYLEYTWMKAPSQQPVDFRNIRKPSDSAEIPGIYMDSKKTDSTTIILNDSIPKIGVWYIVIFTKYRRFIAIHCNVFRKDEEIERTLMEYKRSIECHRHLYKSFGDFKAAARMNLSLSLRKYKDDTSTDVFY